MGLSYVRLSKTVFILSYPGWEFTETIDIARKTCTDSQESGLLLVHVGRNIISQAVSWLWLYITDLETDSTVLYTRKMEK